MRVVVISAIIVLAAAPSAWAQDPIATLRGPTPLTEQPEAPRMPQVVNEDQKRQRNYPEQPPTIPHAIRDYQIDLNVNKWTDMNPAPSPPNGKRGGEGMDEADRNREGPDRTAALSKNIVTTTNTTAERHAGVCLR